MDVLPLDEDRTLNSFNILLEFFNADSILHDSTPTTRVTLDELKLTPTQIELMQKVVDTYNEEDFFLSVDEMLECVNLYKYIGFTIGGLFTYDLVDDSDKLAIYYYELISTANQYVDVNKRLQIIHDLFSNYQFSSLSIVVCKIFENNRLDLLQYNLVLSKIQEHIYGFILYDAWYKDSDFFFNTREKLQSIYTLAHIPNTTDSSFSRFVTNLITCIMRLKNKHTSLDLVEYYCSIANLDVSNYITIAERNLHIPYLRKYSSGNSIFVLEEGNFTNSNITRSYSKEDIDFLLNYFRNNEQNKIWIIRIVSYQSPLEIMLYALSKVREYYNTDIALNEYFWEKIVYLYTNKRINIVNYNLIFDYCKLHDNTDLLDELYKINPDEISQYKPPNPTKKVVQWIAKHLDVNNHNFRFYFRKYVLILAKDE
jgi:hypothetical protein